MVTPKKPLKVHKSSRELQLQKITDLCNEIHSGQDIPDLLLMVARGGSRLLEAERVTLFLLDHEQGELWSPVTLDGEPIRFDARLGIAGASVMTGEVMNIPNAQEDEHFYQAIDARTKFTTQSVLAIPLFDSKREVIGTLQALNKRGGVFQQEDEEVAKLIAGQVSRAVENTTTLNNLKARQERLDRERASLLKEVECKFSTKNIIGVSEQVQANIRLIEQIRDSAVNVLITGESGTGKELIAKALHYNSPRAGNPFVALNCAALPESLIESELFGHESNAFTGAQRKRIGRFELAHTGTLFLDEIGDLSLSAQTKILRVLQEHEIDRLGGEGSRSINVRVIAATNVNLEQAMKQGTFRSDLYYRLRVVPIHTAPLREIPEDIQLLAEFFLQQECVEMGRQPMHLSPEVKQAFIKYAWPGNVRELQNEIKRLAVTVRRAVIAEKDLPPHIQGKSTGGEITGVGPVKTLKQSVEELEVREIKNALRLCQGNRVRTAKMLGLSRQGLLKKIARYTIN